MSTTPTTPADIEAYIQRGEVDFDILHQVVHADASTTITTDSGSIPSLARVMSIIADSVTKSIVTTSTTTQLFTDGDKTFNVEAGKSFKPSMPILAVSASGYLYGTVVSYAGNTLIINVTSFQGAGGDTNWNITLTGPMGPAGSGGGSGGSGSNAQLITKMPWE